MKEEENEVDQMTISQYFQYHKPISPELKLGKPMTKKKRTRGPKFRAKKVFSGHDDLRKRKMCKRKWVIYDSSEDSEVETNIVMERAKEVQENLDPNFPSFIKLMLRSHVTKGFWMGLPSSFCKLHLPKCNKTIVLEDESGKEYETNFLTDKCGLCGGWKAFSAAHKLVEGDVVVFQLVQPFKFKMYMVRANDMTEVDGALGLLNLDVSTRESDFGCKDMDSIKCKKEGEKRLRPLSPEICEKKNQMTTMVINYSPEPLADQIHSSTKDLGSEEVHRKDYSLSSSFVDLKNFKLFLHGSSIDSEMPKHLRIKYYELCCKQKSYLHQHLVRSVSSALATGIIAETINIADAIRACNLSTSQEDFALWDKTLEAFELLGMKVGFLRGRLNRLVSFAFNPVRVAESKRIMEARLEQDHVQDEIIALEQKLMELKRIKDGLDEEIEGLKVNEEIDEFFFLEEANASW